MLVELGFAVITTIGRVGAVLGTIEFAGVHELVGQVELSSNRLGDVAMPPRITGTVSRHAQHLPGPGTIGRPGEVRAVDTSAVGDED